MGLGQAYSLYYEKKLIKNKIGNYLIQFNCFFKSLNSGDNYVYRP